VGPSDTAPLPMLAIGAPPPDLHPPDYQPYRGPLPRSRGITYLLRGLGLVGVAVVSGLIWLACQPKVVAGIPAAQTDQSPGKYSFTRITGPTSDPTCAPHSYGRTQQFFQQHPCQRLTRALYSTTLPEGVQAVVSVVVVQMPAADQAAQLQALTKQNNTGNISDLITDGSQLAGAPSGREMREGGFASSVSGNSTTIALSAFVGGHSDKALLKDISNDALRLQAS
jgi:hypothetical protein